MVTISPLGRALVPIDSAAAQRLCSPNYDEFQADREIFDFIAGQPDSVLRITMPHCHAASPDGMLEEGSPEALALAARNMSELIESPLTRVAGDCLAVYEIVDTHRPRTRQIGLAGLAKTDEIRTESNPAGVIVRNEGVREEKARGRADLIRATDAFIGMVNNAVEDEAGNFARALEAVADSRECDFAVVDESGNTHKVWLIEEEERVAPLVKLLQAEPAAYVADGNHRSAAAAMLGAEYFLAVFFPARTMGLAPYNRLVKGRPLPTPELRTLLERSFAVESLGAIPSWQPERTHEIGLYMNGAWLRLVPHAAAYDATNAVSSIDADIVQRGIFEKVFGIRDPRDPRLTFVGGNRDALWLRQQVDGGDHTMAVTLPPVTIDQFISVCRQNRIMPPKSTWFQPKVRSGLFMALGR